MQFFLNNTTTKQPRQNRSHMVIYSLYIPDQASSTTHLITGKGRRGLVPTSAMENSTTSSGSTAILTLLHRKYPASLSGSLTSTVSSGSFILHSHTSSWYCTTTTETLEAFFLSDPNSFASERGFNFDVEQAPSPRLGSARLAGCIWRNRVQVWISAQHLRRPCTL